MTELVLVDHVLLEVETSTGSFSNITGPSMSLDATRQDGDVGELSAQVLDVSLDPAQASGVRPGRGLRFSVRNQDGTGWTRIFTGSLTNPDVTYDPLAEDAKRANVTVPASDAVQVLAGITEQRGVGTVDGLRWLVGTQVPFIINGSSAVAASGTVVAFNDNASLWDQILVTRDSALGYAWVDQLGRLRVYDAAQMSTAIAATIGPAQYRNLDVAFALDQVINSVLVNWRRTNIGTDTSADITYGPYEDAASIAEWGVRQATFTIQGDVEDSAQIEAYAQSILTRNATAAVRAREAVIPIRTVEDLALVRSIDVNSRVQVTYPDGVTVQTLRVVSLNHQVSGEGWVMTLQLAHPDIVVGPVETPGTGVSPVPPGSITDAELSQDLLDQIASSRDGQTPASSPTPILRGGIGSLFVLWSEVVNAGPVIYDVHLSTTSGFTPTADNLAGSAAGRGPLVIRTLPGTATPLVAGTTYYVRIVARDADGPAPAGSQASGTPALVTNVDLAVNALTADMLVANDALIEALNVSDLSTVNLQAARMQGGAIWIAQGTAATLSEPFAGTTMPAGWTSTKTDRQGDSLGGTDGSLVPGASVVSTGPTGQVGSALHIDYGPGGAGTGLSYDAAGQVLTSLPASPDAEISVRFRYQAETTNDDARLMVRATGDPWDTFGPDVWNAVTLNLFEDFGGFAVRSVIGGQETTLGTVLNLSSSPPYGTWWRAKLKATAGVVYAKVWPDTDPEPEWRTFTGASLPDAAGRVGLAWRTNTYFENEPAQRLWVDSVDASTFTTGFKVNDDGTGAWPALGIGPSSGWLYVGASGQPAFQNGWANFGTVPLRFRRDQFGALSIVGKVSGGPNGSTIFTLPVGFRPAQAVEALPVYWNNATPSRFCIANINTAGEVKFFPAGNTGGADVAITITGLSLD